MTHTQPDATGHFGPYGGRFVPEVLMAPLEELEKAYLALGMEVGLDFALANPEKTPGPLPKDHPMVASLRHALEQGRAQGGESSEVSGYRQAEAIMGVCRGAEGDD